MKDREGVIKHTVDCIRYHCGRHLENAFDEWMAADSPNMRSFHESRLHDGLVAMANGYDGYCGNGSTHEHRVRAAKAALEAWGE